MKQHESQCKQSEKPLISRYSSVMGPSHGGARIQEARGGNDTRLDPGWFTQNVQAQFLVIRERVLPPPLCDNLFQNSSKVFRNDFFRLPSGKKCWTTTCQHTYAHTGISITIVIVQGERSARQDRARQHSPPLVFTDPAEEIFLEITNLWSFLKTKSSDDFLM